MLSQGHPRESLRMGNFDRQMKYQVFVGLSISMKKNGLYMGS